MLAEEQQLVVMLQRDDTLQGSKQVPCSGRSFQKWFEHHPMIQRSPELKLVLKKENRRTRAKKILQRGQQGKPQRSQCEGWDTEMGAEPVISEISQFRKEGHGL